MSQLPQTRQSLLVRLQGQSSDAWAEFLEIYEQAILNYSRSRGLQDADARDVTQEVLAAVTNKIESWDPTMTRGTFRGWLFRAARNIAVDRIRKQSRQAKASGDTRVAQMLSETPGDTDADSDAFWAEYRRKVFHWAAEKVRPEVKESSWQSFWLTSVEGRKPEEIAEQLGLSIGSVYAAKFRIVARLREIISRLDEAGEYEESILSQIRNVEEDE
ncbi:MAG: RNA polymerase sigma factor [Planctomycetaceae bacterium]